MTALERLQAIVDASKATEVEVLELLIQSGSLTESEQNALIERVDPLGVVDFYSLD
jgi:hypothetical protein